MSKQVDLAKKALDKAKADYDRYDEEVYRPILSASKLPPPTWKIVAETHTDFQREYYTALFSYLRIRWQEVDSSPGVTDEQMIDGIIESLYRLKDLEK